MISTRSARHPWPATPARPGNSWRNCRHAACRGRRGQQLRAVAVELVRRGLRVALVGYRDGWTELEATLPRAPHLGPVTVDRDAAGTTC